MKTVFLFSGIGIIFLFSCSTAEEHRTKESQDSTKRNTCKENSALPGDDYLTKWDFDGDGKRDTISFDYMGGAHCCYKINIKLSSEDSVRKFPFEMDGGYVMGVDSSQPDHFAIGNFDSDTLPEIRMGIDTYNGEEYPVDPEAADAYPISSNHILFDYTGGKLVVKDDRVHP